MPSLQEKEAQLALPRILPLWEDGWWQVLNYPEWFMKLKGRALRQRKMWPIIMSRSHLSRMHSPKMFWILYLDMKELANPFLEAAENLRSTVRVILSSQVLELQFLYFLIFLSSRVFKVSEFPSSLVAASRVLKLANSWVLQFLSSWIPEFLNSWVPEFLSS